MHTNKNDRNRTHTTIARLQSHFRSPTLLWSDYIQLLVRHAPARAHTDSKTRRHDKTPRTGHGHGNRNDGRYIESKHRRGGRPLGDQSAAHADAPRCHRSLSIVTRATRSPRTRMHE